VFSCYSLYYLLSYFIFYLLLRLPPTSTLFPYTTLFRSFHGSQTISCSATSTGFCMFTKQIACFKTNQRHAFYTQSSNGQFAWFSIGDDFVFVVQQLCNDQFGMMMPTLKLIAFGKSSTHFSRSISRI